ncbi:unnamed protein product [Lampetra planeri]
MPSRLCVSVQKYIISISISHGGFSPTAFGTIPRKAGGFTWEDAGKRGDDNPHALAHEVGGVGSTQLCRLAATRKPHAYNTARQRSSGLPTSKNLPRSKNPASLYEQACGWELSAGPISTDGDTLVAAAGFEARSLCDERRRTRCRCLVPSPRAS